MTEALDDLPDTFRKRLDNVAIVIEEWPDRETMQRAGAAHPAQLLGHYHGIPLIRRTHDYGLVLPDKISIYRQPILVRCRTRTEVRAMIRRVLLHEVAHHLGIDEDRLREIGAS
ncbi:MAG: metallopeptidase family protein [Anaerolineae bacterium]